MFYPRASAIAPLSSTNSSNEDSDSGTVAAETAISMEKVSQMVHAEERTKIFKNILSNTSSEYKSFKYIFSGFVSVIAAIVASSLYTLLLVHDVVKNPEYWYEFPFQISVAFSPIYAIHMMYDCAVFTNTDFIKSYCTWFALFMASFAPTWIMITAGYTIWTYALRLQYPVPLIGYIMFSAILVAVLVTLWYKFPFDWRKNQIFRKRLKWGLFAIYILNFAPLQYAAVSGALDAIPKDFQWIAAIFLPLVREFNGWAIEKMALKSVGGDPASTKIYIIQTVNVCYASFLTYNIGSIATIASTSIMIGTDFMINIIQCLRIIYLNRMGGNRRNTEKIIELLQELAITESVECSVPLTYIGVFLMAFYGPNGDVIGAIRNSYWHFSAVDDIAHTIKFVCMFFLIDFSSLVICAILLWFCSKINFYYAYAAIQKEFGVPFAATLALVMNGVSKKISSQVTWLYYYYI